MGFRKTSTSTWRSLVAAACLVAIALLACRGEKMATVDTPTVGTFSTTGTLAGGKEIGFWVDLDAAWTGDWAPRYDIELSQGGKAVATVVCHPLNVSAKLNSVVTNMGRRHSRRYKGKMKCEATVPGGKTKVRATLTYKATPKTLKVRKMELQLTQ